MKIELHNMFAALSEEDEEPMSDGASSLGVQSIGVTAPGPHRRSIKVRFPFSGPFEVEIGLSRNILGLGLLMARLTSTLTPETLIPKTPDPETIDPKSPNPKP